MFAHNFTTMSHALPFSPSKAGRFTFEAALVVKSQQVLCPGNDYYLVQPDVSKPFIEHNVFEIGTFVLDPKVFGVCQQIKDVRTKLNEEARKAGAIYVGNGTTNLAKKVKKYRNICFRGYIDSKNRKQLSGGASAKGESQEVKVSSTNNNRKWHSRPNGKSLSRRTITKRATKRDDICKSTYNIYQNEHCYFINTTNPPEGHTRHAKITDEIDGIFKAPISKSQNEDRAKMRLAAPTGRSLSVGMHLLDNKATFTQQQVRNMGRKDPVPKINLKYEELAGCHTAEGVQQLLNDLGCRVLMLRSTNPSKQKTSSNEPALLVTLERSDPKEVESNDNSTVFNTESLPHNTTGGTMMSVTKESNDKQMIKSSCGVSLTTQDREGLCNWFEFNKNMPSENNKESLICMAWTTPDQFLLAHGFSLNISIDVTHKVCNIANLKLLTISTKDSFANTKVILRMWIPNERVWVFKFILNEVFPKMFGNPYCRRIQGIVSDGDIHLTKTIDNAIKTTFPNATRVPCSWHIVDRTMNACRSQFHIKRHISAYWKEWFLRFIQTWLYTFTKPRQGGIDGEDEYVLSKCILLGVLNDKALEAYFTKEGIEALLEYLNDKIFTKEGEYKAYSRDVLYNWEFHSNSAHEGTNLAIKKIADGVSPTDSLGQASYKMWKYDHSTLHIERKSKAASEHFGEKTFTKNWAGLTTHSAGLIMKESRSGCNKSVAWSTQQDSAFYIMESIEDTFENLESKINIEHLGSDEPFLAATESAETIHGTTGAKQKVSLKELRKLSSKELQQHMSPDEKTMMGVLKKDVLNIPKFAHIYKVTLSESSDGGKIIMNCSCNYDKRVRVICECKFAVWDKYLRHVSGVLEWNYKSINPIHWASWAYYISVTDKDVLSEKEKRLFSWMKNEVRNPDYNGTDILMSESISLSSMYSTFSDIESGMKKGISDPQEWFFKPGVERLLNYSQKEALSYMKLSSIQMGEFSHHQRSLHLPPRWYMCDEHLWHELSHHIHSAKRTRNDHE